MELHRRVQNTVHDLRNRQRFAFKLAPVIADSIRFHRNDPPMASGRQGRGGRLIAKTAGGFLTPSNAQFGSEVQSKFKLSAGTIYRRRR